MGRLTNWNKNINEKLMELEDEHDGWYLDENGYRLKDEELFNSSPWVLIGNEGKQTKVIMRSLDGENGQVEFALKPWFRIADELNNPV